MKDFWKEFQEKKIEKSNLKIILIVIIILVLLIAVFIIYKKNDKVRNWIDKNILQKEVIQNKLTSIDINESDNANIYAFNKYIAILAKNNLKIYNNVGAEETNENIEITTPIFSSEGRYLTIAEDNGTKIYGIEDKNVIWDTDIEGKISQIRVNKNGYVAVIISDTSYKTVIALYDNHGAEMFKQYLSNTRVSDVAISGDNKYLALSEIDTSGTIIQSNIKIISIEKAQNDPGNSLQKDIQGKNNDLIVNIKYHDKDKLICKYTDKITAISSNYEEEIIADNNEKKLSFAEIELQNDVVTAQEKSTGLFTADSVLTIIDTDNKHKSEYTTKSVAKELYADTNIIALNLGTEVEFVNTNGSLVKRYVAEQEITKITVSSAIAGIIYRDRIEIVNL